MTLDGSTSGGKNITITAAANNRHFTAIGTLTTQGVTLSGGVVRALLLLLARLGIWRAPVPDTCASVLHHDCPCAALGDCPCTRR